MFSIYDTPQLITEPISTNSFSYDERKTLLGHTPQITITPRKIGGFDDVQLGSHIVIEEIDHRGTLQSRTGLQHNIYIDRPTPIAIMDNHNHALGIWWKEQEGRRKKEAKSPSKSFQSLPQPSKSSLSPVVIHIDAHADLEPVEQPLNLQHISPLGKREARREVWDYVHSQTHIGSFIQPALDSGLISDCIQIRSYYALEQLVTRNWSLDTSIILDIDLDFWAHESSIPTQHVQVLQKLLSPLSEGEGSGVRLITIATSPHFLDQHKAIRFLEQLKPIL